MVFLFAGDFEYIEWLVFKVFLLVCFVGGIWRILDAEFRIKKTFKRWRKKLRKAHSLAATAQPAGLTTQPGGLTIQPAGATIQPAGATAQPAGAGPKSERKTISLTLLD